MIFNTIIIANNPVKLISFTVEHDSMQAEEGMTWIDWINSSYFKLGCPMSYEDGQVIWTTDKRYDLVYNDGSYVYDNDVIQNNYDYILKEHVDLINFTIDSISISYQAEEGMTWMKWVNSKYNTTQIYIDEVTNYIVFDNCGDYSMVISLSDGGYPLVDDTIISNYIYDLSMMMNY